MRERGVIVLTGASSDLGCALALEAARRGSLIVLVAGREVHGDRGPQIGMGRFLAWFAVRLVRNGITALARLGLRTLASRET
jgi:NAD(P)-dependent dehydrogenase (short-subunit alcohol dehydrogenase family)